MVSVAPNLILLLGMIDVYLLILTAYLDTDSVDYLCNLALGTCLRCSTTATTGTLALYLFQKYFMQNQPARFLTRQVSNTTGSRYSFCLFCARYAELLISDDAYPFAP